MGNSFTSIHAYNTKALSKETILQRIDDFYLNLGYDIVAENEISDVNVYLFYKKGEPWVTIYEDTCEDLTAEELAGCVERFSRILVLPVVIASVYDSESASFAYGDARDPDRVVTISDEDERNDFMGRFRFSIPPAFAELIPLLKKPMDRYKLYKVWWGNYQYPEEKLAAFSSLFGISPALAACGYRIYDQKFRKNGKFPPEGYAVATRCYHKGGDVMQNEKAFLPVMEAVGYDKTICAMKEFYVAFRNVMASSKGVDFYVFGKAVDQSLRSGNYRPAHVKAVYRDYDGKTHECIRPFAEVGFVNDRKGLCAKFNDVDLVKGETLEFYLTLKDLPRSEECVRVAVMPAENPKEGQCGVEVDNR